MSDRADLSGHRILVLEDSFLVALDIRHYLRAAGAVVLGPYGSESAALHDLDDASPTGAVLDINSGAGASYEVAGLLQARGIPFIFFSSYQPEVVPAEFVGSPYIQKCAALARLVEELAALLGRGMPSPDVLRTLAFGSSDRTRLV